MQIIQLQPRDKKEVLSLYRSAGEHLRKQGIKQWDWFYPNGFVIGQDLKQGNMFGVKMDQRVIAAVVVDTHLSPKYQAFHWADSNGNPACIHRLVVDSGQQGKGLGKKLLQFAEALAIKQGHTSIRLDVYSENPTALGMYRRAGYQEVGKIRYPFRPAPFLCYEKILPTEGETL